MMQERMERVLKTIYNMFVGGNVGNGISNNTTVGSSSNNNGGGSSSGNGTNNGASLALAGRLPVS